MNEIRLQKILSTFGYGSRRDCEKIIADRRVKVNNEIAVLGDSADIDTDKIEVDGQLIQSSETEKIYIALNKPIKYLSDIKKKDRRKTVIDLVSIDSYVFIVGRLDYMSEGLILLTNDGKLANELTHPRYMHEKEYRVLVKGHLSKKQLVAWRNGVVLETGYKTLPADVFILEDVKTHTWLNITLREGKKRQIREMGKATGLQVVRIIRIRIATLKLGTLKPGEWRYLSDDEEKELLNYRKNNHPR